MDLNGLAEKLGGIRSGAPVDANGAPLAVTPDAQTQEQPGMLQADSVMGWPHGLPSTKLRVLAEMRRRGIQPGWLDRVSEFLTSAQRPATPAQPLPPEVYPE